jgi:hypothetical protein
MTIKERKTDEIKFLFSRYPREKKKGPEFFTKVPEIFFCSATQSECRETPRAVLGGAYIYKEGVAN